MDELLTLCVGVAILVAVVWMALPFYVLHRLKELDSVLRRLRSLERFVYEDTGLREPPRARPSTPVAPVQTASVDAQPVTTPTVEMKLPVEATLEPEPYLAVEVIRETPPPRKLSGDAPKRVEDWSAIDWESWLGSRGLGWTAVVLLLFATAFFFKEAFERNWIGPLGRVLIGVALGSAALAAGYWQHRQAARLTSQMLTAAGIVLLYLSMYATFGFYHLLQTSEAGPLLVGVVVLAFSLAVYYDAMGIAVMGVVGALLNPLLLASSEDLYVNFFLYLTVVNAGVAGLLLVRRWQVLAWLVILGAQFLFWMWYVDRFHSEKLTAAIAFQLAMAAIWIGQQIAGPLTRFASLTPDEGPRLCVQATLFAIAGFVLLDKNFHEWIGKISLLVAVLHAGLSYLAHQRRPRDMAHALVEFGISMGFLAAVMPLEAGAPWIGLCWAVQGFTLWAFSLRIRNTPIRGMAITLFALAVLQFLLHHGAVWRNIPDPFVPIFNSYAMPGLAIAACLIGAALLARREGLFAPDRVVSEAIGLGGLAMVWLILSVEAYEYFAVRQLPREAHASLSIVWTVYALTLMVLGLRLSSGSLRLAAALVFGFAVAHLAVNHVEHARDRLAPFPPLLNTHAIPGILLSAALIGSAVLYRRERFRNDLPDFSLGRVLGLAGIVLLGFVLSSEVFDSFRSRGLDRGANAALSIFWSLYAIILLTLGLRLPSQPLRWCALGLFALTLGKVVTVDMGHLPGLYRVAAFACLSLMMGAAAWAYQKVKLALLVAEEEKRDAGK